MKTNLGLKFEPLKISRIKLASSKLACTKLIIKKNKSCLNYTCRKILDGVVGTFRRGNEFTVRCSILRNIIKEVPVDLEESPKKEQIKEKDIENRNRSSSRLKENAKNQSSQKRKSFTPKPSSSARNIKVSLLGHSNFNVQGKRIIRLNSSKIE